MNKILCQDRVGAGEAQQVGGQTAWPQNLVSPATDLILGVKDETLGAASLGGLVVLASDELPAGLRGVEDTILTETGTSPTGRLQPGSAPADTVSRLRKKTLGLLNEEDHSIWAEARLNNTSVAEEECVSQCVTLYGMWNYVVEVCVRTNRAEVYVQGFRGFFFINRHIFWSLGELGASNIGLIDFGTK